MPHNGMRPIHPGEVLREEFLSPLNLAPSRLATLIDVPANRMTELVAERRNVTADTALRLARVFGTTPEFWMNLQAAYDLRLAELEAGRAIEKIVPIAAA